MIIKFQIDKIEDVQKYNGMNSKISCDKIRIDNDLIAEQWNLFNSAVGDATDSKISGKVHGYILVGQPSQKDETHQPIVFVKAGSPVTQVNSDKSISFTCSPNNELEDISDVVCRLYLSSDFIVVGETLYTFTYKFENIFNIEKTMQKMKMSVISDIIGTGAFSNNDDIQSFMKSYTSTRTFLSLNKDRMERLSIPSNRIDIAQLLNLGIDSAGTIQIDTREQAHQLIKYLCYKIFQDKESDRIIEVNSVVNDNVKVRAAS
jgi:hypothetical protein